MNIICRNLNNLRIHASHTLNVNNFHTSSLCLAWTKSEIPRQFLNHNKKIYPPQNIDEEPRNAVSLYKTSYNINK